jgi:lycopene cyclase domain-containing protein
MISYIVAVLVLFLLFLILNFVLGTKLITNYKFWIMQLFVAVMVVVFDYFAHDIIWSFNEQQIVGLNIVKTPIENLIFGFSLIGISIVLFENDINKRQT